MNAANEALAVILKKPATAREVGNAVWNPGNLARSAFTSPATRILRQLEREGLVIEVACPLGKGPSLWMVGMGLVR